MKLDTLLPLVFAVLADACSQTGSSNVSNPPKPLMAPQPIVCELRVHALGPRFSLSFVLSNQTAQTKVIHYFRPFMQFDLHVTAIGRPLTVLQKEFDGPVAPAELQLPPNGSATLETPITLEFASQAPARSDTMTWTIVGNRPVELLATLHIDGEGPLQCTASIPGS